MNMKAIVLKEPGSIVVAEVPELIPEDGLVLLKVRMIGLCGTDLNSFLGRNSMIAFPRILGHEVAATVMGGIEGAPDLRLGQDVTLSPYTNCGKCPSCLRGRQNACQFNQTLGVQRDGAMTEYIAVPADRLFAAKLSLRELCLVEPLTIGFHAVSRGRVSSADSVAVIGCGGVGLGAVAASVARSAKTIGIDVDDDKLRIANLAGATHTINTQAESLHERLLELTDGRGPDVIIEAIGLAETFRVAVEEVAFTGRVVYIGYANDPVTYETKLFVQKELDILGSRNALPEDFREVIRMLEEKRFPVDEAISRVASMEEVPETLRAWSTAPSKTKKIMVSLDRV